MMPSSPVSAAPIEARLQLTTLLCVKPTWEEKDNIYLLVIAKNAPRHDLFKERLPSPADHWYMDPTPAHNTLTGVSLWSGTLAEGEAVDLSIFVMDEDKGVPGGWVGMTQAALNEMPGPPSSTIGSTLNVMGYLAIKFDIQNVDDFPGSFHVRIHNRNGHVTTTWRAGEHAEDKGDDTPRTLGKDERAHNFWLNGDNSNYRASLTMSLP
jgi:hypothetical protein